MANDFRDADGINVAADVPGHLPDDIRGLTQIRDASVVTAPRPTVRQSPLAGFALVSVVVFSAVLGAAAYIFEYLPLSEKVGGLEAELEKLRSDLDAEKRRATGLAEERDELLSEKDALDAALAQEKGKEAALVQERDQLDAKVRALAKEQEKAKAEARAKSKKSKRRRSSKRRGRRR